MSADSSHEIGDGRATLSRRGRPRSGACLATHPSVSMDEVDARFRHLGALRRALGINGKQASAIWAGIRGSRRAWRTCAFCESARQHAGAGLTLAALAFAQKRASRLLAADPVAPLLPRQPQTHDCWSSSLSSSPRRRPTVHGSAPSRITRISARSAEIRGHDAAKESNLPSGGLPRPAGLKSRPGTPKAHGYGLFGQVRSGSAESYLLTSGHISGHTRWPHPRESNSAPTSRLGRRSPRWSRRPAALGAD